MNKTLTYLETGSKNPYYNLAFEEYVLCNRLEGDYLLLWQNENTIVIGQHQNAEAEINRAFVEAHRINVVRRTTGGGAVYHDLGNLNYSFITDVGEASQLNMELFIRPVVEALKGLNLNAKASGRNDILVDSKKISGVAQRIAGNRILHHGTLLFDSNTGMLAGALRVKPGKFHSKAVKSVRSRIGNIRDFLEKDMDLPAFWNYLKQFFGEEKMISGTLTDVELAEVEHLKQMKYDTWDWNFGRSPAYNMSNERRWNGGSLEVRARVEDGWITEMYFYGDFLARKSLDDILDKFKGCPFQREFIEERIKEIPIEEYFGGISLEEVLQTIFL